MDEFQQSARKLTFAAMIAVIAIAVLMSFYITLATATTTTVTTTFSTGGHTTTTTSTSPPVSPMVILMPLAVFGAIGLFWVVLDYFLIYRKVSEGNLEGAETPSLVLGIIQLIFGGLIPGILLLMAHGKITSSLSYRR